MTGCKILMGTTPLSHARNAAMLTALLLLCSCMPGIQQRGNMDVTATVYVQPEKPVDLSGKKLLVAPLSLYTPQSQDWIPSVTGLVQDIFSQERVFKVIELKKQGFESRENMLNDARIRGFDYVLLGSVPPVIFPAGNTSGWTGFDMRLVSTGSHVTLWHIYGQASLVPAPTRRSILGDAAHADAPSVSSGFAAIVRKMAVIINCQAEGSACAAP